VGTSDLKPLWPDQPAFSYLITAEIEMKGRRRLFGSWDLSHDKADAEQQQDKSAEEDFQLKPP
jgi:hypothetical protein